MTPPNQPQQSDVSDYQFSKPISFTNATQSNRKHPWELEPGAELVKCNMFVGEKNPAPTWPWPSFGGGVTLNDYFDSGPYRVYLGGHTGIGQQGGAATNNPIYSWNSPAIAYNSTASGWIPSSYQDLRNVWDGLGPNGYSSGDFGVHFSGTEPAAYDVYYDITTTVLVVGKYGWFTVDGSLVTAATAERYYTGAGWLRVSSDSNWLWEGCLPLGQGAIAFDSTGIGKFDWTGDINAPFSYRKPIYNFNLAGNAALIAGIAYFIDTGGCLFQTDGSTCQQVMVYGTGLNMKEGPFNAALIPDITWAAGHVNIEFDGADHRLYADLGDGSTYDGDGSLVMIDFRTATFQCKSKGDTVPTIVTGGIQLTKPEYSTIVHYVDINIDCAEGTEVQAWVKDAYDQDGDFVQIETVNAAISGKQVVRIHANRTINRVPQFKFVFDDTSVVAWGIERIAYNEGGVRN